MSRLSDEDINRRVREAMLPAVLGNGHRAMPQAQTLEKLIEKARAKRGAKVEPRLSPEQKTDLKARGL